MSQLLETVFEIHCFFCILFSSSNLVDRYLSKISGTSQEHIRQGFALAIASLPNEMLLTNGTINKVFDCLFNLISISSQTQHLIKQRRDTLIALSNLYENIYQHPRSPFYEEDLSKKYFNGYLRCSRDYTNDRLGDSGRLVRETACSQLVRLLKLINNHDQTKHYLTVATLHNCVYAILTNVCSKIDDLRLVSGKAFLEFLNIEFEKNIDYRDELQKIFHQQMDIDWRNSQVVFQLVVQLINFEKYRFIIWLHCLMTAGELNPASQALYNFLTIHKSNTSFIRLLFDDLEKIFSDKQYSQIRIIIPCVQACERLLSQSTFLFYFQTNPNDFFQHWKTILQSLEEIVTKKSQLLNNNPTLYLHLIKLKCALLQFSHLELRNLVIRALTKFFLHEYPWVRRQAAQNFYDTCIMFNEEIFMCNPSNTDDHADDVMNILTETDWEENLENVTKIRNNLLNLLDIKE